MSITPMGITPSDVASITRIIITIDPKSLDPKEIANINLGRLYINMIYIEASNLEEQAKRLLDYKTHDYWVLLTFTDGSPNPTQHFPNVGLYEDEGEPVPKPREDYLFGNDDDNEAIVSFYYSPISRSFVETLGYKIVDNIALSLAD